MELDVYSDVVCPWCYLGHRRLVAAIERMGPDGEDIHLRWRAFQLDPRATAEPGDLRTVLERKYGPGAFEAMGARLGALGVEAGIDYRFDLALRVGTFDAHRLIQWTQATDRPRVDALAERLFRAYFAEGANVADHPTLIGLADDVDLDPDAAGELLASRSFADEVMADQADAIESGITGVPAVAFNGATLIPGAQDTDTMESILRRLHAKVG